MKEEILEFFANEDGIFEITFDGISFKIGSDDKHTLVKSGTKLLIPKAILKETIKSAKHHIFNGVIGNEKE